MKKILIILVGLFVALAITLTVVVKNFINKDYLAEKIEESINSEVEIGDLDFSILGSPANLTLKNVKLSSKDGKETPIVIKELSLSVGISDLLKKHIDVSSIIISGAEISVIYREDGSNSLEELFEDAKVSERKKEKKPKSDKPSKPKPPVAEEEGSGLNAYDQADFVATLRSFKIIDSRINVTMESMDIQLQCTDVNIELDSIKIDPKKLYETNSADLSIDLAISIDEVKGAHYGNLYLSGSSQTTVFNPDTGELEPNIMGDISIGDESWLNTQVPVVKKAWDKLSVLEKVGINVSGLPTKATFGRSKAIAVHYHLGKVTVLKPVSIWVGDWEIAALAQSWLQSETDQHMIQAELLASEKASKSFAELIDKGLKQLPSKVREKVANDIRNQLLRDNRILVAVQSSGDFSDPKVRPTGTVVDLSDSMKDAGRDYLEDKGKDLLRDLLRKL